MYSFGTANKTRAQDSEKDSKENEKGKMEQEDADRSAKNASGNFSRHFPASLFYFLFSASAS
jgi:hypothetical protein